MQAVLFRTWKLTRWKTDFVYGIELSYSEGLVGKEHFHRIFVRCLDYIIQRNALHCRNNLRHLTVISRKSVTPIQGFYRAREEFLHDLTRFITVLNQRAFFPAIYLLRRECCFHKFGTSIRGTKSAPGTIYPKIEYFGSKKNCSSGLTNLFPTSSDPRALASRQQDFLLFS